MGLRRTTTTRTGRRCKEAASPRRTRAARPSRVSPKPRSVPIAVGDAPGSARFESTSADIRPGGRISRSSRRDAAQGAGRAASAASASVGRSRRDEPSDENVNPLAADGKAADFRPDAESCRQQRPRAKRDAATRRSTAPERPGTVSTRLIPAAIRTRDHVPEAALRTVLIRDSGSPASLIRSPPCPLGRRRASP